MLHRFIGAFGRQNGDFLTGSVLTSRDLLESSAKIHVSELLGEYYEAAGRRGPSPSLRVSSEHHLCTLHRGSSHFRAPAETDARPEDVSGAETEGVTRPSSSGRPIGAEGQASPRGMDRTGSGGTGSAGTDCRPIRVLVKGRPRPSVAGSISRPARSTA